MRRKHHRVDDESDVILCTDADQSNFNDQKEDNLIVYVATVLRVETSMTFCSEYKCIALLLH